MAPLPKLSPEGYRILCYRLADTDPSKMHFGEAVKAFCMFNDVQISEDGPLKGYFVVFDMKGVRLAHLAKVQFGPLRTFMAYIQVNQFNIAGLPGNRFKLIRISLYSTGSTSRTSKEDICCSCCFIH